MIEMPLEIALDRMLTCATAHCCPREEACFVVVQWAREQVQAQQAQPFAQPPPLPESGRETGLGYIWDSEHEGPA